jgi:hypothetical protein
MVRPCWVVAVLVSFCVLEWAVPARAERELIVPFEEGGHVVLDQLSGLRLSSSDGTSYTGPAGFSTKSTKLDPAREASTTTLWLAPSFDWFVTDHFSVGALFEIRHSWGSVTGDGQRLELPGTTSLTVLPRVGFYVPFSDRIGLWPRASVGYASVASVSFAATPGGASPVRDTFHAMVVDLDLSVVYRFGETFFVRAGPELGATLGGQTTEDSSGVQVGAAGTEWQVSATVGFGMNLEL